MSLAAPLLVVVALTGGLPLVIEGVPQIKDQNAYFEADAIAGDVDGVVLCRVDVVGARAWDTFGAVDLAVTLTAGAQRLEMWGAEDRASTIVTAPAVRLRKGDPVVVVVEDRDLTGREVVARARGVYDGTKLAFDLDETQIACRSVPAARAAARAQPYLKSAEQRLSTLQKSAPDLRSISGGWNVLDELTLDAAVRDATSWTGETPATQALQAKKTAAQQAWAASLAQAARAATPASSGKDRRATFSLAGDQLTVTALVDHPGLLRVDVIDDHGAISNVDAGDAFVTERLLKGQSATVTLAPLGAGVVLLRAGVSAGELVPLRR